MGWLDTTSWRLLNADSKTSAIGAFPVSDNSATKRAETPVPIECPQTKIGFDGSNSLAYLYMVFASATNPSSVGRPVESPYPIIMLPFLFVCSKLSYLDSQQPKHANQLRTTIGRVQCDVE